MDDIEEIPVETVGGERPPSAVGDRLLIGLAALALLGGALIAAGNFLSGLTDDAVAATSPSPRSDASAAPTQTARPSRTERPLREVTVEPGDPPEPVEFPEFGTYWLEAKQELPLRSNPSDEASVLGTLAPGDVVLADNQGRRETAPWLFVQEPQPGGWVRVTDRDGNVLAEVVPVIQDYGVGGVASLWGGLAGFMVQTWVTDPGSGSSRFATAFSSDGLVWRDVEGMAESNYGGRAAAWGPSGWIAASSHDRSGIAEAWIWESSDGTSWSALGALRTAGEGFPQQMVASELGYLMSLSTGMNAANLWFSRDGITWQESADPLPEAQTRREDWFGGGVSVLATEHGFVAWVRTEGTDNRLSAAFSTSGRTWSPITIEGEPTAWLELAVAGDSLLGLGRADDGTVLAWRGSIGPGGAELVHAPRLQIAFEGAVVTALTSHDGVAYAFGFLREDGSARAWASDGIGWRRISVPEDGFGTVVRQAAAGPGGVVVVGARQSALGPTPVLWQISADGSWSREPAPTIPHVPDPTAEECGTPPRSALQFMGLDPALAVACFGDEPITFTAWSADCGECWGAVPGRRPDPAWLIEPMPFLLLMPYEGSQNSGWWRSGVMHPDLPWREELVDTWLEITGHFADPAAATCGTTPRPGDEDYWQGREADVWNCQRAFVVTEATVAELP